MTLRVENLLGTLALLIADELRPDDPAGGDAPAAPGLSAQAILNTVEAYPGCTIEHVRAAADLCHPAAVRAVAGLVQAGWIDKRAGADKRAAALYLTDAGLQRVTAARSHRERMLQRIAGRLSVAERAQLDGLLVKILWHETRDPAHALRLCRFCDEAPCLAAGCPVESREQGLPLPGGAV